MSQHLYEYLSNKADAWYATQKARKQDIDLRYTAPEQMPKINSDQVKAVLFVVAEILQPILDEMPEKCYICNDCATYAGAKWPEGHCATVHQGICGQCRQKKGLASIDDWDWPADSRYPGPGAGRD